MFDIDNFPSSESATRMISRVSPIYANAYVGKWLFEVMGSEWDEARQLIESLRMQCYAEQCTWGMRYWEERYGIDVDETKDLEERRAAVLRKRTRQNAMAPASLESVLEALTGRDVAIDEEYSLYKFCISFGEGKQVIDYKAVIERVDTSKPSHLEYSFKLPRTIDSKLYFASGMHEDKTITLTQYSAQGVTNLTWLVDENSDTLTDEKDNILLD